MSIKWMNLVWEAAEAKPQMVSAGELLILLSLADHADAKGRAYPAVTTLGKRAVMTRRSAQKALRRFEAVGILQTELGEGGRYDPDGIGPGGRSLYRFTDPETWPATRVLRDAPQEVTPPASYGTPPGASPRTPPPASYGTPKPSSKPSNKPKTATGAETGPEGMTDAARAATDSGNGFATFWAAYPRRLGWQGRKEAENAWGAEIEGGADPAALVQAAAAYAAEATGAGLDPKFIKSAKRWLEAGAADDYGHVTIAPKPTSGEARWMLNAARFHRGDYRIGHPDWNQPWIVSRAIRQGLGTWDDFSENCWTMPERGEAGE
jgi:hypothetical protein